MALTDDSADDQRAVLTQEFMAVAVAPALRDGDVVSVGVGRLTLDCNLASRLERRRIDAGFFGAAQVDRYGNINTTVVSSGNNPQVRLPGSGACEIALLARKVFVVVLQLQRSLVGCLDFVTSPGVVRSGRPTLSVAVDLTSRSPIAALTVSPRRHEDHWPARSDAALLWVI